MARLQSPTKPAPKTQTSSYYSFLVTVNLPPLVHFLAPPILPFYSNSVPGRPAGRHPSPDSLSPPESNQAMKPDVEVLVERPQGTQPPSRPPPVQPHPGRLRARPYYRRWSPWLVPAAAVACVVVFVVTMYVNNCQRRNAGDCTANFLGRFAFQPLKENPLLGPSSATYVRLCFSLLSCSFRS